MRIIRPGRKPSNEVEFTCRYCDCGFAAVKELEAQLVTGQRDGNFYTARRPVCDTICTKQAQP